MIDRKDFFEFTPAVIAALAYPNYSEGIVLYYKDILEDRNVEFI